MNDENKKKIVDLNEKLRDTAEEQRISSETLKNLEKNHNEKIIYMNEKVIMLIEKRNEEGTGEVRR